MLQAIIENEILGEVLCSVSDAYVALKRAEELKPDLILLDIGLPNMNGIDLAGLLKRIQPQPLILFVTHFCEPSIVNAAMNSGGNGYVLKSQVRQDLPLAIRQVCAGQSFLSATIK